VRWRLIDLAQWIFEEFRITIAKQTLSRELRAMGYRKLSARPGTMRKRKARLRILKKLSRAPGGNRARQGARLRHDRNLVRRRGSHRPEEQDHPSLGDGVAEPSSWHSLGSAEDRLYSSGTASVVDLKFLRICSEFA